MISLLTVHKKGNTAMNKKSSRLLMTSLMLTVALIMSMMLTGCGGGSTTLEDYVNSNEELAKDIESYSASGMTIDITENTLSYVYKYDQKFDDTTAELMTSSLKEAMASMESTFESIRDTLIDDTGIKEISVKIIYTDGSDSVLYEKSY